LRKQIGYGNIDLCFVFEEDDEETGIGKLF